MEKNAEQTNKKEMTNTSKKSTQHHLYHTYYM